MYDYSEQLEIIQLCPPSRSLIDIFRHEGGLYLHFPVDALVLMSTGKVGTVSLKNGTREPYPYTYPISQNCSNYIVTIPADSPLLSKYPTGKEGGE